MPEIGNLAWAAVTSVEGVEILDRFNGVPTLGMIKVDGGLHLFWRCLFYVSDVSAWMYVPLTAEDVAQLDRDDVDVLEGVVFDSPADRYVTLAVAHENRLVFEREWRLPRGMASEEVVPAATDFLDDAMRIALDQDPIPSSRREVIQKAADAVRELIPG